MKKNRFYNFMIFMFLGLFVVACGDPIPIEEMALARVEITNASKVKADKYAPELFKEAKELLMTSHTNIKDDKLPDAKKNALAAGEKAKAAYEKSLPLLAKDTIAIADESLLLADEAFAAELATEEYKTASTILEKSRSLLKSKDHYLSYTKAVEADASAKNARNVALSKKSMLQDAIDEVKTKLSEARKYGAETIVPAKLSLADENVVVAEQSLNELKLKKGFAAIELAKVNADEAYLESLKATAKMNIEDAEKVIKDAEESGAAEMADQELEGSKELLGTAKTQFEQMQYPESIHSSNEAKRLAGIAIVTAEKAAALKTVKVTPKDTKSGTVKSGGVKSSGKFDIYTVKYFESPPKDCLWIIAEKFYKNPRLWKRIFRANKDKIKNPHLIKPGWKLKIPR